MHGRLTRILTLTFAAHVTDPAMVRQAVVTLLGRYRRQLGAAFPFVWVIEPHEDGRLHVHVAVRSRDVRLADLWSHGIVDRNALARCTDPIEAARRVAHYLTETFGNPEVRAAVGRHRYHAARGFAPPRDSAVFPSEDEAIGWAHDAMRHTGTPTLGEMANLGPAGARVLFFAGPSLMGRTGGRKTIESC